MKNKLMNMFFNFMGISGWMVLILIILENRIAFPVSGNNSSLDILEMLTLLTWLITRYEHVVLHRNKKEIS